MKVKTINPVLVNGSRESEPSKYLSANGDEDDFFNAEGEEEFYDLDGSSNKKQIMFFQDWMDVKHPNWVGSTDTAMSNGKTLGKDTTKGYGYFGQSTKKAWDLYQNEFNAGLKNIVNAIKNPTGSATTPAGSVTPNPVDVAISDATVTDAPKGFFGKMSTGEKIGIVVGISLIGLIIFAAVHKGGKVAKA